MSIGPPILLVAALLVAALLGSTRVHAGPEGLEALRWQSRVLVVLAPHADDPDLAQQVRLYEGALAGARERDLVLVTGIGADPSAQAMRRPFGAPAGAFRAILVGKDGGAKLTSARPIAAERLFDTIDAMPMRRDEQRRDRMRNEGRGRS